jgi:hypothetical protein
MGEGSRGVLILRCLVWCLQWLSYLARMKMTGLFLLDKSVRRNIAGDELKPQMGVNQDAGEIIFDLMIDRAVSTRIKDVN